MTIFLKNQSSFSMVIWKNIKELLELLAIACMQVKKTGSNKEVGSCTGKSTTALEQALERNSRIQSISVILTPRLRVSLSLVSL